MSATKKPKPDMILTLEGYPGVGKSTLAILLERVLDLMGIDGSIQDDDDAYLGELGSLLSMELRSRLHTGRCRAPLRIEIRTKHVTKSDKRFKKLRTVISGTASQLREASEKLEAVGLSVFELSGAASRLEAAHAEDIRLAELEDWKP